MPARDGVGAVASAEGEGLAGVADGAGLDATVIDSSPHPASTARAAAAATAATRSDRERTDV
jgi:hypothetical protein